MVSLFNPFRIVSRFLILNAVIRSIRKVPLQSCPFPQRFLSGLRIMKFILAFSAIDLLF